MNARTDSNAPGQTGETRPLKPHPATFKNEAGQADGSQPEMHPETRRFLETYFNGQSVFVCAIPPDGAPIGGTFSIPGGLDQLAVDG